MHRKAFVRVATYLALTVATALLQLGGCDYGGGSYSAAPTVDSWNFNCPDGGLYC
jgi:hypothetical protein